MTGDRQIRWVWAYDENGRRVTDAEAVLFVECPRCSRLHSIFEIEVGKPGGMDPPRRRLLLAPRPDAPFVAAAVRGVASSPFFPDGE